MPVSRDDPRAPYVQIADDLRHQIRDGQLQPGAKLPSIAELARRWEVAPMTVQHALRVLRQQGLVVSHQGRGSFVHDSPTLEPAPETRSQDRPVDEPATLDEARQLIKQLTERMDRLERQQQDLSRDPGPSPDAGRGLGD